MHNKDIVVLYSLYATNTYRQTGPNHFVGDYVYRILIHAAKMLIITTSCYKCISLKYFHLAALVLSVICFLPDLCIMAALCTSHYFDNDNWIFISDLCCFNSSCCFTFLCSSPVCFILGYFVLPPLQHASSFLLYNDVQTCRSCQ